MRSFQDALDELGALPQEDSLITDLEALIESDLHANDPTASMESTGPLASFADALASLESQGEGGSLPDVEMSLSAPTDEQMQARWTHTHAHYCRPPG